MKTVKIFLILGILSIVSTVVIGRMAHANIQCGIKPIAPLGCQSSDAVCVCDRNGNCEWEWHC